VQGCAVTHQKMLGLEVAQRPGRLRGETGAAARMAVEQLHYGHHLAQRLRGAQGGFVRDRIHEPHASLVRESVRGTLHRLLGRPGNRPRLAVVHRGLGHAG